MSGLRICEISHFFCYAAYRQKAAAMARRTGERELLIVPAGWSEDYHGSGTEPDVSDEYILRFRRALMNWQLWGPKRFQLFMLTPRVIQDLRDFRPDIIDVDSEPFGLLALEIALIRHLFLPRSLLVVHSSQTLYKRYPFPFSRSEAFVLAEATALFARTSTVRDVLLRKSRRRPVYVVPHGVDTQTFSPGPDTGRPDSGDRSGLRIGYVGALARHKGVHTLFDAILGLRVPYSLSVVGDGPERPALEARAAHAPVPDCIRFHGGVPNARLPAVLRTLDVLVVPSMTMPNWNEQFGRVIIEAMACGVPVVGSTCGAIPEVIGDAGLVFPEDDAGQLRAALESLARDRVAACELGRRARQRAVEHYSWEAVTGRVHELYRELLRTEGR
jgi:glycosyltransferase involved in cell wall biosynthesis